MTPVIRRSQVLEAVRALGIDPMAVTSVYLDAFYAEIHYAHGQSQYIEISPDPEEGE